MQTPHELVPEVSEHGDRLVYFCKSRSGGNPRRVDMEKRFGLGECNCPNYQKGGNFDCWHLQKVRKYMSLQLAQGVMEQNLSR